MAGKKISQLPAVTSASLNDIFPVVQAGITYKESIQQLSNLLSVEINISIKRPCLVATTVNLTATYANGGSGIDATLTNAGVQAPLTIDGVALSIGDRVLVKNQSSALQNGIYSVTNIGSVVTNWVLTRTTDYDEVVQINPGDWIIVTAGSTQANTSWIETAIVISIGVSAITFSQFTASFPISVQFGGTGLTTFTTPYGLVSAGTTATGALQTLATGSTGQVLQSAGASALPTWSTPTYPSSSGTTNTLIRSNGTNNVYTTATFADTYTANNILYASGTNAVAGGTPTTIAALFTLPTSQSFTSGSGTYNTPANCRYIIISMVGGGGGGGGSGNTGTAPTNGGNGGNTVFSTLTAGGGGGGNASNVGNFGGLGGITSGTGNLLNIAGKAGFSKGISIGGQIVYGGPGGDSYLGNGGCRGDYDDAGQAGTGFGGGGQGGALSAGNGPGCGGGGGGFVKHRINLPANSYSYSVGAAGTAGAADTGGVAGAAGSAGYILVEEYYI